MINKTFIIALSKFYKSFLTDTIRSIELLKNIQKEYPEDYKKWVQIQKDPSALLELSNSLDEESRKTI